jgi:hypothetical protein
MADTYRDLNSVIDELKRCRARILDWDSGPLTLIQAKVYQDQIVTELKNAGISYDVHWDLDSGSTNYSKIQFRLSAAGVRGTGTVADVMPVGTSPIQLSCGDHTTVRFEPRDLKRIDEFKRREISNSEFADLSRGSSYEFQGAIRYCEYYFNQGPKSHFEFWVDRDGDTGTDEGALARLFRTLFR